MRRSFPDQKSQIKNYHWSWKSFVKEWKNCLLFTNQVKKWKRFLKKNCWVSKLYVNFARIFIVLINSLPAPLLYSDINIQDLPNSLKIEFPSKRCGSEKYVTLFTEFLAEYYISGFTEFLAEYYISGFPEFLAEYYISGFPEFLAE